MDTKIDEMRVRIEGTFEKGLMRELLKIHDKFRHYYISCQKMMFLR